MPCCLQSFVIWAIFLQHAVCSHLSDRSLAQTHWNVLRCKFFSHVQNRTRPSVQWISSWQLLSIPLFYRVKTWPEQLMATRWNDVPVQEGLAGLTFNSDWCGLEYVPRNDDIRTVWHCLVLHWSREVTKIPCQLKNGKCLLWGLWIMKLCGENAYTASYEINVWTKFVEDSYRRHSC